MNKTTTPAEYFRDYGYALTLKLAKLEEIAAAKKRREELESWPGRHPNLVRAKQGRAS